MKNIKLLAAVALLTGCATMSVVTEFSHTADFGKLKTFDFATGNQVQPADATVDITQAKQRIRAIIVEELSAKGYRQQSNGPDFLIGYQVKGVSKREEMDQDPFAVGSGPAWEDMPRTPIVRHYREGSVTLTVGDPSTHKIIWRGSAGGELSKSPSMEERVAKTKEAIHEILQKFPPQ